MTEKRRYLLMVTSAKRVTYKNLSSERYKLIISGKSVPSWWHEAQEIEVQVEPGNWEKIK